MRTILTAALALAGAGLIIYGLALVYVPVAIIAAGALLVWVARAASEVI